MTKAESKDYHCRVERKRFDPDKGTRLSVPFIQTYGEKEFKLYVKRSLERQGWTIDILFDPTEVPQKVAEPKVEPEKEVEIPSEENTTRKVAPRRK